MVVASPVLTWATLQQSTRIGAAKTASNTLQRVLSNGAKELPRWAIPFSSRHIHSSAVSLKGKDDATLHSVSINWQEEPIEGSKQVNDHLQMLLEWKLLQNKTHTEPLRMSAVENLGQTELPSLQTSLSSSFFDPSTNLGKVHHLSETIKLPLPKHTREKPLKRDVYEPLWITGLDDSTLVSASQQSMLQIRAGERDVSRLARNLMHSLDSNATTLLVGDSYVQQQAQLFVFSQWVAKAHNALASSCLEDSSISLCIKITDDLYQSLCEADNQVSSTYHPVLQQIQRASMHRLFSLIYPCTRFRSPAGSYKVPLQALKLIAKLLRDRRMKAAQVRYLCQQFLSRFEFFVRAQNSRERDYEPLWRETVMSFLVLIKSGIVIPTSNCNQLPSEDTNMVDKLLCLLCFGSQKGQMGASWAQEAILDVARVSQNANLQRKTLPTDKHGTPDLSAIPSIPQDQDSLLDEVPFVSQEALKDISLSLVQAGKYDTARKLIYMAPKEQRSLAILSFLMRRWSNVLPTFTTDTRTLQRQSVRSRRQAFGHCTISQQLWNEAMSLVDPTDAANYPQLIVIFNARMRSHARSKATGLVLPDLRALRSVQPERKSLAGVLGQFSQIPRVDIVKTYARAGRLVDAKKWANRILSAAQKRQEIEKEIINLDQLKVRMLNVLLLAHLKLQGRGKTFMTRWRYALLIRKGGAMKKNRMHLRATINRYLRQQKNGLVLSSSPTSRKRLYRFRQAVNFMKHFTARFDILPDDQTSIILLAAILRLSPRVLSYEVLLQIKEHADFNWADKGVAVVLDELQTILAGIDSVTKVEGQTSKGTARRTAMIDAAIQHWHVRLLHGTVGQSRVRTSS